jgi:hypothetical protein
VFNDLAAADLVSQLHLTGDVSGGAQLVQVTDMRAVEKAHPYAKVILDSLKDKAAPEAVALPTTIGPFDTGYITFNNGVPVGGYASLTLHSDGTCQFSGHFHVSGAPSYNVSFAWVIADSGGTAYTFTAHGHLAGTFESGSRDYNWNVTVNNPTVAANWAKLVAGYRWQWTASVRWDVAATLKDTIDAIKTYWPYVSAAIAVIAA